MQIPPGLADQGVCHKSRCSGLGEGQSASWYNDEHSAIRFATPNARHAGHDRATLANRAMLYANARAQNQARWSGKTCNWQPAGPVWLNPEHETSAHDIRDAA